jgi:hypothetical protein
MLNVPKEIADEPMNMALSGKNRKSYERTPELNSYESLQMGGYTSFISNNPFGPTTSLIVYTAGIVLC